jgi:hypothetical protein
MTSNFDIATAVATCVLAVASIVAGVFAFLAWKDQRKGTGAQVELARDTKPVLEQQLPVIKAQLVASEQAASDRIRGQAVQLVAWIDYAVSDSSRAAGTTSGRWPQLVIANTATSPAWNLTIGWGAYFEGLSPEDEVRVVDTSTRLRQILPNDRIQLAMPDLSELREMFGAGDDFAGALDAYVEFDDANGHRWQRFTTGALRQIS